MKKFIAAFLCLLLLPLCAFAEAAPADEWIVSDFGDFTMQVKGTDPVQMGTGEDSVLFSLFPDYSETNIFHDNMNVTWFNTNVNELIADFTEEEVKQLGNELFDNNAQALSDNGIAVTNPRMLDVIYDGALILYYSLDCDYNGRGVDFQTTLYQMQIYIGYEDGTYVYTMSALTPDSILNMIENYFQTISFK